MATYSKETSLFKTGAIGAGIQEAGEKATNYLSQDDSGIMIYDATDGNIQYPSTATSKNVFIDSNSVDIRNGQEVLATFGSEARIGKENGQNLTLSNSGLSFKVGAKKLVDLYADESTGGISFYKPSDGVQIRVGEISSDGTGNLTIRSNGQTKGIFLATTAVNIPAILCNDEGFSSLFSIISRTVMSSRSISAGTVVNSSAVVTVPSDREILGVVGYSVDSGDINVASLLLRHNYVGATGYSQTIDYNIKNVGSVSRTTALNVQLLCVRVNFTL